MKKERGRWERGHWAKQEATAQAGKKLDSADKFEELKKSIIGSVWIGLFFAETENLLLKLL